MAGFRMEAGRNSFVENLNEYATPSRLENTQLQHEVLLFLLF